MTNKCKVTYYTKLSTLGLVLDRFFDHISGLLYHSLLPSVKSDWKLP